MKNRTGIIGLFMGFSLIAGLVTGCGAKTVAENPDAADTVVSGTENPETEAAEKENVEKDNVEKENSETENSETASTGDISIVYTNDVHSYIANVVKDDDGNVTADGLRFSKIAAMVKDMEAAGNEVLLVDAGDEIQGDIYGAQDEGQTIVDIMSATGYDVATPGNHEFDYGTFQFFKIVDRAAFPYISCNFKSVETGEAVLPKTEIFDVADKKIAFVGITTPYTIASSTPTYFQDESGKYIYDIAGINDAGEFYSCVQETIDEVSAEADYVIALGHVGVGMDERANGLSSIDVIENTTGLDAFIDGHSHSAIEGDVIKDKDGRDVILTQTGNYLSAVGLMKISPDGDISTELIKDYENQDETVAAMEDEWIKKIDETMSEKIGTIDFDLTADDPEDDSRRFVRAMEMNIGDFCADSMYWYFNEKMGIDCDVALVNGGGVRTSIKKGDITYLSVKSVLPFGNMVCLISATGQQIMDAIEFGARKTGEWDDDLNIPAECGGFMHPAGLKYSIDTGVESSVIVGEDGAFKSADGDYRVKDVQVYNRASGKYEPIDLNKTYALAGNNFILRNSGDGINMFAGDELVVDYVGLDYIILSDYIKSFKDGDGTVRVKTENSPLVKYAGFMLDYENPYGAERVSIR